MRKILALLLALASMEAMAVPPWTGILDSSRAIDWSGKGVSGGIPTNRTQCGSTITAYTGTAGTINTAISNCGANQYVKLGAGTFNLSSGITLNKDNVTLRGSGSNSTFLVFTGDTSCQGYWTAICLGGYDLSYYAAEGAPGHTATWTASNYNQGQTLITLSSTTGLSVGMFLVLDRTDSASDPTDTEVFVCRSSTLCSQANGQEFGRAGRNQRQWVKVTNISGSDVTISPGLYFSAWGSFSPGAYWGNSSGMAFGIGLENLSVDASGNALGNASIIQFMSASDSWVKGVRASYAPRSWVNMYNSARNTIRDSYFFGSKDNSPDCGGSVHYGIEALNTGDNLVENNIIQRRTSPMMRNGDVGSVWGYNYIINDRLATQTACTTDHPFMQAGNYSHQSGNGMILDEGNDSVGFKGDIVWATSNMFTMFRNFARGWEANKTSETGAFVLYAYNRFWNIVGNVAGTNSYHTIYEDKTNPVTRTEVIFSLGSDDGGGSAFDSYVSSTLMRWGNYDTVNDATQWNSSEVPTALTKYSNAVPADQNLPNSFYLTSKPAFFGSKPYPPIGPDVTCSDCVSETNIGSHVNRIPARVCFEAMGGTANDTSPKAFDSGTCYASLLPAPTNPRSRPVRWPFQLPDFFRRVMTWQY